MISIERVIIERWDCNENDTHCHLPDFDGIHDRQGSVATASTEDFVAVGIAAGKLKPYLDGWAIIGYWPNCQELCELVAAVLPLDENQIALARGQLEDEGRNDDGELLKATDIEVAVLDWQAREILAEEARDVVNPFDSKSRGVEQLLTSWENK